MKLYFTHEDHLREDDSGRNDVAVVMYSDYASLTDALAAEIERRKSAEEVVDTLILGTLPDVDCQNQEQAMRKDTRVKAQYISIKLHGGSGYTVHRNHIDLGDSILGELDGLEEGDKITLTFTPINMSDEQYEKLGDFEGH